MSRVREKALELAITALGYGMPVSDREELLAVAEVFRAWIDPPEPAATDYPRMSGVDWADPEAARMAAVPERY